MGEEGRVVGVLREQRGERCSGRRWEGGATDSIGVGCKRGTWDCAEEAGRACWGGEGGRHIAWRQSGGASEGVDGLCMGGEDIAGRLAEAHGH